MAVKKKSNTTSVKKTTVPIAAKAKPVATTAFRTPLTKSQLLITLSEITGVPKKQTAAVLQELSAVISRHLKKGAAGVFTLPGLVKIKTFNKPARKARKGINPFTGEEAMFKAKPASTGVKVQALKALKGMV